MVVVVTFIYFYSRYFQTRTDCFAVCRSVARPQCFYYSTSAHGCYHMSSRQAALRRPSPHRLSRSTRLRYSTAWCSTPTASWTGCLGCWNSLPWAVRSRSPRVSPRCSGDRGLSVSTSASYLRRRSTWCCLSPAKRTVRGRWLCVDWRLATG